MYFRNALPLLRLLEGLLVVFLTPLPRYLQEGCCGADDHAPNRFDEGFEASLRKGLMEMRSFFKDFFKRAGDDIAPPAKKKKAEIPRPRWVESQHIPVVMHGGGPFQGGSGYRQHFEVRGGPPCGFRGRGWRVRGGRRGGY